MLQFRSVLLFAPLLMMAHAASASVDADDSGGGAPGVNPKDLVTKVDLIFKRDVFDGGAASNSWTVKYDRALTSQLGIAVELPYAELRAGGRVVGGMAESKLKLRHVTTRGRISWVAGGEMVIPTESDPLLGSGTWQLNPSVGAVYAVSPTIFTFAGVQRFQSVDRDRGASPVRQNQVRMLAARVSPQGWWVLGDAKISRDLVLDQDLLDLELEAGRMLNSSLALSLRAGKSMLDSSRDFGVVVNFRVLM